MNDSAPAEIKLIMGLGNPSVVYSRHRHNVGFWCVDLLADAFKCKFKTSRLYWSAEAKYEGQKLLLIKPSTYMNDSGRAAASLLAHHRIRPEQMLVICDSLDLPTGQLRLRPSGSHGGHNGLRSIIADTGSQAFPRMRIGISRPKIDGRPTTDREAVKDYVLREPTREENRILEEAVERAASAVEHLLRNGIDAAMNVYNTK